MKPEFTLDWNCVIEVEEQRPQAQDVLELINRHRKGDIEVALLAASASENTRSKRFPGHANIFKDRVAALGWQNLPIVLMPCIFDLSYMDFCYCVGDDFQRDMDALWEVIAPNLPNRPSNFLPDGTELNGTAIQSEALSKWRNTWCDVVSAYSHIHAGRDVFVTNNTKDFQKNSVGLSKLGMQHIATPELALLRISEAT
ncbi:hypothetical protein [Roseobacter sp. CCS2]|uniref:hypothetical protein n=1 Tax=Roseobacter sp. CCS2 TaxID=391593 RepID=UPI0000F3C722|nr:hypothetical protein [Roseobacter sp. CCS2]EBA11895.1 hypothetical protein RCCS2_18241 [Roseobacter sp. CCS2]